MKEAKGRTGHRFKNASRHGRPLRPAISLVIVTFDSRDDVVACLEAVGRQSGAPQFETIVVDNGSSDGTADLVRSRYPKVKIVEQANLGFGAGNNRGVREAAGEVVVFLNPDTVPEPGFLAGMHAAVAPGQVATAQIVLKSEPARLNTAGHRLHFTGYGFVVAFRQSRWPPGPPEPTQGFSGAAFAMRRDDYQRLGGFDEDFFLYMEDTEFSWRLHRAGFRIVVARDAVTEHDYELGIPPWKIAQLETGRLLLLRKHLPRRLWIAYLPSLLLAEALAWGRAAWVGPKGLAAKWTGLRAGWRRGIVRYDLPRARPHLFASQAIPFGALTTKRWIATLAAPVNLLFRLNTFLWLFRKARSPRLRDERQPPPAGPAH
jgi:GT2 family glycosyltransferase